MFKKYIYVFINLCIIIGLVSCAVESAVKEGSLIDWGQTYVEATGMAVAPEGKTEAQGKALARRGAIVDLQRNMLEFIGGVQIDSRTTMDDFMADDRVRSEVHGFINRIEILKGEWDGEAYTVTGRIRTSELKVFIERVCGVTINIR